MPGNLDSLSQYGVVGYTLYVISNFDRVSVATLRIRLLIPCRIYFKQKETQPPKALSRKLSQFDKRVPDVPKNLKPDMFPRVRDLVQRHAVHLDGRLELLLLEVDVAHVDLCGNQSSTCASFWGLSWSA